MAFDIKNYGRKLLRVWRVLKRPGREEYWNVAKISAIGILLIGLIGFIISLLIRQITPR